MKEDSEKLAKELSEDFLETVKTDFRKGGYKTSEYSFDSVKKTIKILEEKLKFKEDSEMKNYFNVLAIHREISFNKKCITTGEIEKTAEYYSMAGFKDSEIIIQEYPGALMKKETTWELWGVKITPGQIISDI